MQETKPLPNQRALQSPVPLLCFCWGWAPRAPPALAPLVAARHAPTEAQPAWPFRLLSLFNH